MRRPQVFSTSRRFVPLAIARPALFHAGDTHGISPSKVTLSIRSTASQRPYLLPVVAARQRSRAGGIATKRTNAWRGEVYHPGSRLWAHRESVSAGRCYPLSADRASLDVHDNPVLSSVPNRVASSPRVSPLRPRPRFVPVVGHHSKVTPCVRPLPRSPLMGFVTALHPKANRYPGSTECQRPEDRLASFESYLPSTRFVSSP